MSVRAADAGRFEGWISAVLRVGVVASAVLIAVGTVISFLHHPAWTHSRVDLPPLLRGEQRFPHALRDVLRQDAHLRGRGVIMTGTLLLIATPVARVALSVLVFRSQRDRRFVAITSVVFLLLMLSFLLGRAGG